MKHGRKASSDEDREWIRDYLASGNQKCLVDLEKKYHYSLLHHILDTANTRKKTSEDNGILTSPNPLDEVKAEDILQETFAKAFAKLDTYNEKFAFSTWLFKIAKNCCRDYLRKENRKNRTRPLKDSDSVQDNESVHPEYSGPKNSGNNHLEASEAENNHLSVFMPTDFPAEDDTKEVKQMLDEMMEILPEKYRRVFFLRHLEKMKYKQIAQIEKLPVGTVKTYIFRAKKYLKIHAKK